MQTVTRYDFDDLKETYKGYTLKQLKRMFIDNADTLNEMNMVYGMARTLEGVKNGEEIKRMRLVIQNEQKLVNFISETIEERKQDDNTSVN